MNQRTCSIPGCDRKHCGRGWCKLHLRRWLRTGDPLNSPRPVEERFWSKVDKSGDCWLWTASLKANGYGSFELDRRTHYPHRVSYQWAYGPIPEGMDIDHKCHVRHCVRPSHMQAVTRQANLENQGAHPHSATGVRGVYCARSGRFYVAAKTAGVRHYGGRFDTVEEAEAAAIALRNRVMTNNLLDLPPDPCDAAQSG